MSRPVARRVGRVDRVKLTELLARSERILWTQGFKPENPGGDIYCDPFFVVEP